MHWNGFVGFVVFFEKASNINAAEENIIQHFPLIEFPKREAA